MGKRSPDAAIYESDDGFVEDAPKSKKAKIEKSSKMGKTVAKRNAASSGASDGELHWEVSGLWDRVVWLMGLEAGLMREGWIDFEHETDRYI